MTNHRPAGTDIEVSTDNDRDCDPDSDPDTDSGNSTAIFIPLGVRSVHELLSPVSIVSS